jgi:glutamate synthase domain-containing protein 3
MTGGRVVVLGATGRNFGAGMSGGIAYIHDPGGVFPERVNYEMVSLTGLDATDEAFVRTAVESHLSETGSVVASRLLDDWDTALQAFIKVMPNDYQRVLNATERAQREGLDVTETIMAAAQK